MVYLTLTERKFLVDLLEDIVDEHTAGESAPIFFPDVEERLFQALEILRLPTKKEDE